VDGGSALLVAKRSRKVAAVSGELSEIFRQAGCTGQVCVRSRRTAREIVLGADEPAVPASVIKVLIAVEIERQCAEGRLDPVRRVRLRADERTGGPVGFSLYEDDVEVSVRDLVVSMLTISDNVATDALIGLVGLDACNAAGRVIGMRRTTLASDLRSLIDGIAEDAGFADWQDLLRWQAGSPPATDRERVDEQIAGGRALDPQLGTSTTPHDMCTLLDAIWSDTAAPPEACARVRRLMAAQLTRQRIASGFLPPAKVSAKSGGLMGVVRNEVGVIEYPNDTFVAAIFTRSAGGEDAAINAAIGAAAAAAVSRLRERT
jgi:beta-lactamase class A